jgi:hypothetical protein
MVPVDGFELLDLNVENLFFLNSYNNPKSFVVIRRWTHYSIEVAK